MLNLTRTDPPKVLMGMPNGGTCHVQHMYWQTGILGSMNPAETQIIQGHCAGSNIAFNQNKLARRAIVEGFDYLFLVETDNVGPYDALKRLLAHDKDIVGATYQWKEPDLISSLLNGEDRHPRYMGHELDDTEITLAGLISNEERLRRVRFVPMGCTLISVKALKAVSALVAEKTRAPEGKWGPPFTHNVTYAQDSDEGQISTTDSAFCGDAREAGYDIWLDADLSLMMNHRGDADFMVKPVT